MTTNDERNMLRQSVHFGPTAWGPAIDEPELMGDTPVGEVCSRCDEKIAEGDYGLTQPHISFEPRSVTIRAVHRECFLRSIVGSLGHQMQRCSCYGGTEEDPPDMTKRQAALAAVAFANLRKADGAKKSPR